MKSRRTSAYRLRGLLMVPPCLFLTFMLTGKTELDQVIWPVGLGVFALGFSIRVWAQIHLHYRLPISKQLTATGPYAFVRNPIYIGNMLILLGFTVLSEILWFLPVMLLWCVTVYTFVVRQEEAHLLDKYGKPYLEYQSSVSRWRPKFRGLQNEKVGKPIFESLKAEAHCLLCLLPVVGKEIFSRVV